MHRILVLATLVACGHHDDKPRPAPTAGSALAQPVGLEVGPARNLELLVLDDAGGTPADRNHRLVQLHFFANEPVETKTTCRTDAYNVHLLRIAPNPANARAGELYVDMAEDVLDGPKDPSACEATLYAGKAKQGTAVCWRAGKVTLGPCPAGTFPPPVLPDKFAIDFHVRSLVAPQSGSTIVLYLDGEYTVGDPIDAAKVTYGLACDGVAGRATAFSPELELLGRGETASVHHQAFELEHPVSGVPRHCTLSIAASDKSIGTFCITEGKSSAPGACAR